MAVKINHMKCCLSKDPNCPTHCIDACPVEALTKPKDRIVVDAKKCISCGACIEACPPKAIDFDE
jgi:ferredoxin